MSTAQHSSRPRNSTGDSFFAWDGDVLVVNILGKPAASKDGKATDHMLRFLAPLFGVPVSRIEVVFGRENVNKQLRITAPTQLPAVFTQGALNR